MHWGIYTWDNERHPSKAEGPITWQFGRETVSMPVIRKAPVDSDMHWGNDTLLRLLQASKALKPMKVHTGNATDIKVLFIVKTPEPIKEQAGNVI